jgi:glutamyl-tRNA synthetase
MSKKVRVRFAPSPTGGLHLGGVRTVLYNYLFAKKHGGDFIVRIEDTDQSRYVPGAEEYIFDCLRWCGLEPDESVQHGGAFGPYRQSERKPIYREYAEKLIAQGDAYYAFDTPAELESMRENYKTEQNPSPQYDHTLRLKMRNSLTLSPEEVTALLTSGTPHVIRIQMPGTGSISFTDMIRGEVSFDMATVDDKVLRKADGMPTYHLAVVVDDHLMQISHAFRGEEWLPSAPVHIRLWEKLFGREAMPAWAHLPLILGPNGKLSKRDGAKYGFPVFAMNWTDPKTGETVEGFRERGFLPEAFINLLSMLGWNDGTEKEIFSLDELVQAFSMERVHSAGAKFDYEKAKWYNQEWLRGKPVQEIILALRSQFESLNSLNSLNSLRLERIVELVRDRCHLLTDFKEQMSYFMEYPKTVDVAAIQPKWNVEKTAFFQALMDRYGAMESWSALELEESFKTLATEQSIKPGELMLPLRIMLVGGKFGPGVFDIADILGKEETLHRIGVLIPQLANN